MDDASTFFSSTPPAPGPPPGIFSSFLSFSFSKPFSFNKNDVVSPYFSFERDDVRNSFELI
jgi:hypothetical protein